MDNIIKFIVSNEYVSAQPGEEVHDVIYSIDKNFLLGAAVSATSILINSQQKFNFHFFTDFINDDYLNKFNELAKKFKTNIYIYMVDNSSFAHFPVRAKWTVATYYRFIAFHYLANVKNRSKALYLDADVVCKNSPDALFDLSLDGKYAAVIPDLDTVQQKCEARLGLPGLAGNYFNAGVIYLNLNEWKANNLTDKSLAMIGDKSVEYSFLDQDILNILFCGNSVLLPGKYNQIYDAAHHFGARTLHEAHQTITDETVFIHYTSNSKPWLQWMRYPSSHWFDLAFEQSPWHGSPLHDAHSVNLLKLRSKHEYRQKHYLRSLLTQVRYLYKKLTPGNPPRPF